MAAVALSGCNQSIDDDVAIDSASGEFVEVSVSASLSGDQTRVSVDNGGEMNGVWAIGWEYGDATSGWAGDGYLANFTMSTYTDEDNATFGGSGKEGDMRLVYPQVTAQDSGDLVLDLSSQSVNCETDQHYDFGGKSLYMVSDKFAVSNTDTSIENLQMNHILTYVELRVTNLTEAALTLTKAVVRGVQNKAVVSFDDLTLTGSGESITIDVTNATDLAVNDTLLIPFSTLPTTFTNGSEVTIYLYFSDDSFTTITKSISNDLEFAVGTHNYFTCDVTSTNTVWDLNSFSATSYPSTDTWEIADDTVEAMDGSYEEDGDFAGLRNALAAAKKEERNITVVIYYLGATNGSIHTTFPAYAFKGCEDLTSVEFLKTSTFNGVNTIGISAFEGCLSLTSIDLSNIVTIDTNAFSECQSLVSPIDLSNAIYINKNAFFGCSSLTDVELPEALSLGDAAFCECAKLTSIKLPKVKSIGENAFNSSTQLTTLEIATETGATINDLATNFLGSNSTISQDVDLTIGVDNLNGKATINGNVLTVGSTEYTFKSINGDYDSN